MEQRGQRAYDGEHRAGDPEPLQPPRQARCERALDRVHQDGDEESEGQRHRDHHGRFERPRGQDHGDDRSNPTTTLEVGRADPLPRAGSGSRGSRSGSAAPWGARERLGAKGGISSPYSSRSVPRCRSPWRAGRDRLRPVLVTRRPPRWPPGCGWCWRSALPSPCWHLAFLASYRSSSLIWGP